MTRKSRREVESALELLDPDDGDDGPDRVIIRRDLVDESGEVVERSEKVIDL